MTETAVRQRALQAHLVQFADHLARPLNRSGQVLRAIGQFADAGVLAEVRENDLDAPVGQIEKPKSPAQVVFALQVYCIKVR